MPDPTQHPVHFSKLVDAGAYFSGRIKMRPRTSWLVPSIQWKDREAGLVRALMGLHLREFKPTDMMLLDEGVAPFTQAEAMVARLLDRTREWILDEDESGLYIPQGRFDYHARRFKSYAGFWLIGQLTPKELKELSTGDDGGDAPVWEPNNGYVSTKYRI